MKISKPWWLAGGISLNCIDEIQKIIMPVGYDISSNIEISLTEILVISIQFIKTGIHNWKELSWLN